MNRQRIHRNTRFLGSVLIVLAGLVFPWANAGAVLQIGWYTVDGGGATASTGGTLRLGGTAGQPDAGTAAQGAYRLYGGFWKGGAYAAAIEDELPVAIAPLRIVSGLPNPFSASTRIVLELPAPSAVRARVFDPTGRVVKHLYDGVLPTGRNEVVWDGRGDDGRRFPSGVYLLNVCAGDTVLKRSLVMID